MKKLNYSKQWNLLRVMLLSAGCLTAFGQMPDLPAETAATADAAKTPAEEPAGSDTVSIQTDGGTIREVLNIFAIQTGRNVVIGPDVVSEDVSIHLNNVQWDEALEVILKPYGFGYRQVGDTIVISKLEKLVALEAVEPLQTRVFDLKFVDAADVKDMLTGQLSSRGSMSVMVARGQKGWEFATQSRSMNSRSASSLSKRARIGDDKADDQQSKSKTIVVTDIPGVLNKIADVLSVVDRKPQQILVESRFVEVNESFLRDIGVQFNRATFDIGGNPAGFRDSFYLIEPNAFSPASTDITGGPLNTLGEFSFSSGSAEVLLNLLQEDDDSKVLSAPKVLTLNNQEATIIVGEKFPIIESDVSGSSGDSITSTTLDYYENIGIQLNVVPQISGEDYVNMIVHPSVSSIADFETGAVSAGAQQQSLTRYPRIKTREAETQILLKNSETIVIGGLLEERDGTTVLKVPLLGDIPLIGRLFRRTTDDTRTVDLLIFLSARIVDVDAPPIDLTEQAMKKESAPAKKDMTGEKAEETPSADEAVNSPE